MDASAVLCPPQVFMLSCFLLGNLMREWCAVKEVDRNSPNTVMSSINTAYHSPSTQCYFRKVSLHGVRYCIISYCRATLRKYIKHPFSDWGWRQHLNPGGNARGGLQMAYRKGSKIPIEISRNPINLTVLGRGAWIPPKPSLVASFCKPPSSHYTKPR